MEKDEDQANGSLPSKPVRSRAAEAERQAEARRERAAKTLRENLLRRKQQGRARRAGAPDEASGLPGARIDAASGSATPAEDEPRAAVNSRESGE
ncbi:hypothetical protein QO002_001086 [Pararhizobium capsulatum DSM 1112]|uniref:Uncharacterized protein n=1 Tax=Pararhizobium capsulatum DSM 1112 TaxID=1121113 RepID=A0ABU0BL22_9HYPH|nr:hypothetical protein [Pararhizobium capsulatum DSM 1112]